MKTVAVLGGGIGGLAASFYLSKNPQVTKVTHNKHRFTFTSSIVYSLSVVFNSEQNQDIYSFLK